MIRILALLVALACTPALAAVGLTTIPGKGDDGPVTVFYPTHAAAQPVTRGPFKLVVAENAEPARGNGRLVVISHGSGGAPWVHSDLAIVLVDAGFVVALPEHVGDNYHDLSLVGPASWKRRPVEVSDAIDVVAADARFKPLVDVSKVGMFGMSAGGHTALALAGGTWSPHRLLEHCEAHIDDDFQSCVGLATKLDGGILDGLKKAIALWVIRRKLGDDTAYGHTDPRIAAIVAGVPFAADFDPATLASPRAALALVPSREDHWLVPKYHGDAIAKACLPRCEILADFAHGGHGALLSPLPPEMGGLLAELIGDPPGFDRSEVAVAYRKMAAFFRDHLLP